MCRGHEFVLVVKAGRFRRAVPFTLPESAACNTTMLRRRAGQPDAPPPLDNDGVGTNIPRIAVSTDKRRDGVRARKMGLAHAEFGNPGPQATPHRACTSIVAGRT